jgi:hypothetical protein
MKCGEIEINGCSKSMFSEYSSQCRSNMISSVRKAALDLFEYCKLNDWAGYDPYDGLKSPMFKWFPFLQNRPARLIFIQFMKRSKLNFRVIMGISKDRNPKGLALFSSAVVKLLDIGLINDSAIALSIIQHLVQLRTPNQQYACWGYNFDWQQRRLLVPEFTPNIICTSFAGNALLDAYEKFGDSSCLEMALSAGNFIIRGLNISKSSNGICFSYTPLDKSQVHNANLLGAAFLARLYSISRNYDFYDHALAAARFSADRQATDGSWPYGESEVQAWIDNFHTGYNLIALHRFSQYMANKEFEGNIVKGFNFYKNHFFAEGCLTKYYHNRLYPIDIHSIAQSIITLVELRKFDRNNMDLALSVCQWGINNMKDREGFFYYQKKRFYKNRISYMRWSQAWMLLAFSMLLEHWGYGTTAEIG